MFKPASLRIRLLGSVLLLIVATNAGGEPPKEAGKDSVNPYEQTRNGITVRVERIAVEQIFNVKGWIRKQDGMHLPPNFEPVPFQIVHVFVSVIIDDAKVGKIKDTHVSFELAESPKIVSPVSGFKLGMGGSAFFAPPMWQKQLPNIEVDPQAKGAHFHKAVSRNAKIEDLFPAKLKYQFTTADGEKIEFLFPNLEF